MFIWKNFPENNNYRGNVVSFLLLQRDHKNGLTVSTSSFLFLFPMTIFSFWFLSPVQRKRKEKKEKAGIWWVTVLNHTIHNYHVTMSNLYLTCHILYSPVGRENLTKCQLRYMLTHGRKYFQFFVDVTFITSRSLPVFRKGRMGSNTPVSFIITSPLTDS